jgi:hypothetical protein
MAKNTIIFNPLEFEWFDYGGFAIIRRIEFDHSLSLKALDSMQENKNYGKE